MEGIRSSLGTLFMEFRKNAKKKIKKNIHIRAVHNFFSKNQPEHIE
jgi:hypothetical protein